MRFKTELRIMTEQKETAFDRYINRVISGDIKNLTIKEEYIMLEILKEKREAYAAELEQLKQTTDLEAIKNARFELVKETIAKEVEDEFNAKLAAVELKISHYDFVIAEEEEKAAAELTVAEHVEEIVEG